ncbi:zinc finger CCCH domain-containing protein 30 [Lycium ferocissimum]|uniref:zinc finger CCCH domain-containing protein 30 n=1 Tax=Lycium ferocissimum TaxID=112874 RepID=UPI0028153669|nr:zinc finger CCCH domain-containing protein 30 [Lycium ferocissimum]
MKKSNRVSWATGPNLRQVKHFLQEDCPSKVGRGSQHHLQLSRSPPGIIRPSFEGRHCLKQSKERLPLIRLAKWKCPPKFNLNEKWRMVAGEESKEAEDQERREKRVLEAVYPSQSAIPANPSTSSDLDQYYDDNQTQVVPIIGIEEAEDVEVSSHLTPAQNISSKLPDACLPNSPSSSVSIVTSQKLPANGKSFSPSLSTFQNPKKPPSKSPFSVRCPANVQSAPPYLLKCQNLKGSEQTQVSPKPPVSYNSLPQYPLTCKLLSTPDQTEFSPDLLANQNHAPNCRKVCGNQNISQLKSQVSGMPPANDNPVTQFPSTCENPNIPQHQAEVSPKSLTNPTPATQCNNQNSPKLPANGICVPRSQSRSEHLGVPKHKTQVSPKPPVSYNSVLQYPLTCKLLSTPDQTEFSPDLPANQNHAPKCRKVCGNQIVSQLKSQVSGMPPANDNPVTQFPSTCENPNIPQHQAEVLPKSLANHTPATQCNNQNSLKLPANGICIPRSQSNSENLGVPKHKTQVCSYPPASEKSILEMPHGFEGGDLMVAVATTVAALAKSQEQGSLIDTDLLVKLLSNPEQIQKLMNEQGGATNPKTGAASNPIVPSSTTPRSTADSLNKQVTGKVINKPINEYQVPHAGSGPIFGPMPMAKSAPMAINKPDTSMKSNLANEQGAPPHVGTADIRRNMPLVHPTSHLNLEKIKKLINEYGAPDNVGGKPLVNSELVPSSSSKCDVVSLHSPNTGHTSPFISMTSPAPLHKDINYYKSLIKQHGENPESVDHELLQSSNPLDHAELLKNLKPNQGSMNFQKRCAFFGKPRGCLNGNSCPFLHDMSGQRRSGGMLEAPGSKRMKLTGELTGRT